MSTLVECVPNFSEGRDKAKVDAIIEAMKIPGVYLLDREMDADHNRCVITLAGDRENIGEAAIRGVGKAADLVAFPARGQDPLRDVLETNATPTCVFAGGAMSRL